MGKETLVENICHWIAWHLPHKVIYFCGIRMWAYASGTGCSYQDASTITMDATIDCWDNYKNKGYVRVPDNLEAEPPGRD